MLENGHFEIKGSDSYLQTIDGSPSEKCEIIRYLGKVNGPIVEIGPGSGSSLRRISHLNAELQQPNFVIAIDNNPEILERLRRDKYSIDGVQLLRADIVHGLPFQPESIGAINTSSVVHELFSYGGGFSAIKRFFGEACMVLEPGGYLIYRDPTGARLDTIDTMNFLNRYAFIFAQFFLEKFLRKNLIGHYNEMQFSEKIFSKKGKTCKFPRGKLPTFSRRLLKERILKTACPHTTNITLTANSALLREIVRHYLTFFEDVIPELLFADKTDSSTNHSRLSFTKKLGFKRFIEWLGKRKKNYKLLDDELGIQIERDVLDEFYKELDAKFKELINPLRLNSILNQEAREILKPILLQERICRVKKRGKTYIRPAAVNAVYDELVLACKKAGVDIQLPPFLRHCCEWGLREGSEYYTYGSPTSIIASAVMNSVIPHKSSHLGFMCLCPVNFDKSHFRLTERKRNSAFIHRNFSVDFRTSRKNILYDNKTTIHFEKVPIEVAIGRLAAYISHTEDANITQALNRLLFLATRSERVFQVRGSLYPAVTGLHPEVIRRIMESGIRVFSVIEREQKQTSYVKTEDIKFPHVALAGAVASGKSTISEILRERGYQVISLSDFIREQLTKKGISNPTREDYFKTGNELRSLYGPDALVQKAIGKILRERYNHFVIDGVRLPEEVDMLRSIFHDTLLIVVDTPAELRLQRMAMREREIDSSDGAVIQRAFDLELGIIPGGTNLQAVIEKADIVIDGKLDIQETRKRVLEVLDRGI